MSGAMRFTRIPAPRKGGQRLIQRRSACAPEPPRSLRRTLRVIPFVNLRALRGPCLSQSWMRSRLRRNRQPAPVDGFEDSIATALQKRPFRLVAELFSVAPVAAVGQGLGAIVVSRARIRVEPA